MYYYLLQKKDKTRLVFFFQAEDGIRDRNVTGVQTCALPIWRCDVAGRDLRRSLGLEIDRRGLVQIGANHELLQVQDDVGDVLRHPLDGRELVQHAVDAYRRDGGARDGRQQRTAERIADRVAETG